MTLSAAAQTGDDGAGDADPQGRIIARIQDRTDDDGVDDYRIEFGFFPQWAMEDKDPWAEAITTWSNWLPRARYLTKTVIDRRDADDNRRWLRSSLISVPAGPSAQQDGSPDADFEGGGDDQQDLIEGRVVARYNPDSRGRLRVEFGFLPECAFESTSNTEAAVEQYGEDLLPRARYLSASMIESRRGVWLRSSVVDVPSCGGTTDPMTTITITSSHLSFEQREEVGSQRIGTVEGPLTDGLDRFTTSGLPDGLTIALTDASANVRRLLLSGTVDPEAVPQLYEVRITVRPPEGEAVSGELTIRILEGDGQQELIWSGYTPDTQRVGGRVTLRQPRVVEGPNSPRWSYASDTSRICTVDPTGDLTLVAVGQCLVTATSAAGEGFRVESIQTEVTVTDKPPPLIRWRGYSPLEATVGESAPRFLPPTATVDGRSVRLTYTYEVDEDSERAGICDVNARNGQIDAMAAGTCVLIAKSAETDEYAAASSARVSVTIVDEKQPPDPHWDGYDDENLRAGGDPIRPIREPQPRVPEARGELTYTYSATPRSICSVNSRTGELTPLREGACEVTASSGETDKFLADEVSVRVDVGPGREHPNLDWFDYPDSPATAAGDALRPSRPGSRDRVGPLSYRSQTPSICSVDSRTGLLSGRERGTCRVTVTSEETDELLEGSETISVRIIPLPLPEPCELNYSRDVEVGGQIGPELDCGDGDARATYDAEETPTICSVNRNSGDVTGLDEGQCRITVTVPATSRYAEATARATLAVIDDEPPPCRDIADVGPLDSGESSRRIYLDDYCEDPEGERLSYTATSSDINVATVRVSGRETLTVTAARRPSGTSAQITVVATDPGGKTGRTSFRVTVDGNTDPERVGSISNVTLDVDEIETIDVSGNFRDADGDRLTYEADSDDSAVRVRVSGSRVTVEGRRAGSATITVTADDRNGGTPAEQTFNVTVNERPPAISISCPSAAEVDERITCTVSNDGGAIATYSWSDSDGGSGSSSSYRISFSSSGTKTVRLTARNDGGSDDDRTSMTVTPTPACTVAPDILTNTNDRSRTYNLDNYCSPGSFRYSARSDNTSVATVAVSGSTLTITIQGVGVANVRFTGTTSDGRSASSEFEVAVNQAPNRDIIPDTSPPSQKVVVGASYARTLGFSSYFHDPDGDEMTHTVASNSRSVRVSLRGSNFVVEGRSHGSATITLTADDGRGSSARTSFTVSALAYPSSGFARCGSDAIRVYYFAASAWPLRKYHLAITGDEATTIFGSSWWSTIGSLSGSECGDWSTGWAYDAAAARRLASELGLP